MERSPVGCSGPLAGWATPPRRSSPRPTAAPCTRAAPTRPWPSRPTSTPPRSCGRRNGWEPTPSTPATASCRENPDFAQAVLDAGLTWIGPTPDSIRAMALKVEAKALAEKAGVPMLTSGTDVFPVLVKASAGGGGKGMRRVDRPEDLDEAIAAAKREAASAFGDDTVFVERYLERARHVEVQVFGDTHGNVVHLFERECSIQRRHQKVVEESPSPGVTPELREQMTSAAVSLAAEIGYVGRGHRGVHGRRRRVLLPGDEHPAAGGAPGHRGDHRPGSGRVADPGGGGGVAAEQSGRGRAQRARDRSAAVRRGSRERLPAQHRHAAGLRPRARGGSGRHRLRGRRHRDRGLRPDAGQGDRARRYPAGGCGQAGRLPAARRYRRGGDEQGLAGRDPRRAGLPRRRHHDRLPGHPPAGARAAT